MDILHRELLDNGQQCYAMIASVNEPHVYLRVKGKILHRWIQGDNIGYYVHITNILESFEDIRDYLHRSKQRVFSITTDRGQIKKVECFDLLAKFETFDENFKERYKDYTWYLPAVFVFTNEQELNTYLDKANTTLYKRLEKSLLKLRQRMSTNK